MISTSILSRFLPALTVLLVWSSAATAQFSEGRSDFWPFEDVRVEGLGGVSTRYVYVAQGSHWEDVVLSGYAAVDGRTHLAVRLNDRTIFQDDIASPQYLNIPIGDLESGYHRIDFRASLSPELPDEAASINYCVDELRIPLILQRMSVTYRQAIEADQPLSALPDILYNPAKPQFRDWYAAYDIDPGDLMAVSAAARLAAVLRASAPVTPVHAWTPLGDQADFLVRIAHDPSLDVPARISFVPTSGQVSDVEVGRVNPDHPPVSAWLDPPSLEISYATTEGLDAAVNALLDPVFRAQLESQTVDLRAPVALPRWAGIASFETLSDFGIGDIELVGSSSESLVLVYPSAWEPVGPPSGQIIVRAQDGLLQGSNVQVWIEEGLAGSSRLDRLAAGDIQRAVPFQASRVPVDAVIGLRLEASLIATDDCLPAAQGTAWIDAEHSAISMPYRLKAGLGSLTPALIAKPLISVSRQTPGMVTAVMGLASALNLMTQYQPVAFEIVSGDDARADSATVRLDVDQAQFREQLLTHAEQLYLPESADNVLIMQESKGFRVLAANDEGLFVFAKFWRDVEAELLPGTTTALLTSTGELVQLIIAPPERSLPYFSRADPLPMIIAAAAIAVLVVILALIGLRYWRRRKMT